MSEFNWLLRDLRLAFRRKDCDEARYLVQKMMVQRGLSSKQRGTLLKLQHAVRTCERRQPLSGDRRRRSRGRKKRR